MILKSRAFEGLLCRAVLILSATTFTSASAEELFIDSRDGSSDGVTLDITSAPNVLSENSWQICVEVAETARSERDFVFFKRTRNVINAKDWFAAHSFRNEAKFCGDIADCEARFKRHYPEGGVYPPCER